MKTVSFIKMEWSESNQKFLMKKLSDERFVFDFKPEYKCFLFSILRALIFWLCTLGKINVGFWDCGSTRFMFPNLTKDRVKPYKMTIEEIE